MRSNIKLLIAAAVVLAVLAVTLTVLLLGGKGEEENVPEETTPAQTETVSRLIYDKDPSQIENIRIRNASGEYDIKKYDDDAWFVPEFVGHTHSTAALVDALDQAATVTSQQVAAEDAEDMSIYGLDSPRADVTITFSGNSEEKTMHIGSDSPSPGLTYVSFDAEKTVHAVNTSDIDIFLNDKFYFIAKTVYTAKQPKDENDTTDYTKINSITISRKDIDYDIVLEYDIRQDDLDIVSGNSSSHIMTSPVRLDLNPDLAYEVLSGVFGLTAAEVAVVSPSEAVMEQFGLADPFAEVNFDIAGENFRFLIGNEYYDEDGKQTGYLCYADGIDIIYVFSNSSVPWATVMPMDITMTMITTTYIYTIDTIDVATADSTAHFKLSGGQDNFAVECSDADVTVDSFKDYYQFILRAAAEELYLEETDAPADITITIVSDYGTDVIEFIRSEDRKTIIRRNGVTSFRCRTAYTDRLIENLGHLLNGENIITVW